MVLPRSSRLDRCLALCRYHRPSQFLRRAVAIFRRKLSPTSPEKYDIGPSTRIQTRKGIGGFGNLLRAKSACWRDFDERPVADLAAGRFAFLSETCELGRPVDWDCRSVSVSHLWRFHLHYHEFLLDALVSRGDPCGADGRVAAAWEIVADWIENNRPSVRGDAWHPFCISKRLPVWMLLWTASPPEPPFRDTVLTSMYAQARFLASHLERDLGGNHLLENLRTLILAGAFFEGPEAERWLEKGIRLFRREAAEQFLPHGEHFERATMYHAIMLDLVLDLRDALGDVRREFADWCGELARRMGVFLRSILHPDGEIPLLGDSAFGEAPPTAAILARLDKAENVSPVDGAACIGDYWTFRSGNDFLLFDRGPVGVDHLPAHAHADLLGFEASLENRRVFIDAGVYNYEDDSLRAYCRGSAAHNVLTVDDVDQCDLWSKFRMGYRGHPTDIKSGRSGGFEWAFAGHNAYRRLGVPSVDRFIACRADGPWFIVDSVCDGSEHVFSSRFHFHPEVEPVLVSEDTVEFEVAGRRFVFQCVGASGVEVEESWYCPRFGVKRPSRAVVCHQRGAAPVRIAWCLFEKQAQATASWSSLDSLKYEDARRVVKIDLPSRDIIEIPSPNNNVKEKPLG